MVTSSGHCRELRVTGGYLDYSLEQATLKTPLIHETQEAREAWGEPHLSHIQCPGRKCSCQGVSMGEQCFEVSVWGSEVHLGPGRRGPSPTPGVSSATQCGDSPVSALGCSCSLQQAFPRPGLDVGGPEPGLGGSGHVTHSCGQTGRWWRCQAQLSPFLVILSQQ